MSGVIETHINAARAFLKFVNGACTPFHVVQIIREKLDSQGFIRLPEESVWPGTQPGGKYYVIRNDSSIVAFILGGRFEPQNGFKIVGAHTDSPNFSLKPKTLKESTGYQQVGVQCYGGGLWHTWFDRDLTVAGRVITKPRISEPKLVHIQKPILRIPTLAIHLTPASDRSSFGPNKESHLVPVIASSIMAKLNTNTSIPTQSGPLMDALANELQCKPDDIVDFDLSVIDTQNATLGGVYDEFIFAPRIDNLVSCFCALEALIEDKTTQDDEMARMICLFDHEEVGSESPSGAGGTLLPDIIERLSDKKCQRSVVTANSFLLSVDGAHGAHPNYPEKHESAHRPQLNDGPVIKYNANVRYATNGATAAVISTLAEKADVPIQKFVVKNDSPCGSTIGPILSTLSGIKTADIGNPQLSMHSIREMCGVSDIFYLTELLKSFFDNYSKKME